jgi:hypothetical protein
MPDRRERRTRPARAGAAWRARRSTVERLVPIAALMALAAGGCTSTSSPGAGSEPDAGAVPAPPPDGPTPPEGPATPRPPSDSDPVPPAVCDEDVATAVAELVAAQLDAFTAGDFARAHGYASESFRAVVDLATFEAIIRRGYGELLEVARHDVLECRSDGARAAVVVGVVTEAGVPSLLGYDLVLEDAGWRVRGAQALGPSGEDRGPALSA